MGNTGNQRGKPGEQAGAVLPDRYGIGARLPEMIDEPFHPIVHARGNVGEQLEEVGVLDSQVLRGHWPEFVDLVNLDPGVIEVGEVEIVLATGVVRAHQHLDRMVERDAGDRTGRFAGPFQLDRQPGQLPLGTARAQSAGDEAEPPKAASGAGAKRAVTEPEDRMLHRQDPGVLVALGSGALQPSQQLEQPGRLDNDLGHLGTGRKILEDRHHLLVGTDQESVHVQPPRIAHPEIAPAGGGGDQPVVKIRRAVEFARFEQDLRLEKLVVADEPVRIGKGDGVLESLLPDEPAGARRNQERVPREALIEQAPPLLERALILDGLELDDVRFERSGGPSQDWNSIVILCDGFERIV